MIVLQAFVTLACVLAAYYPVMLFLRSGWNDNSAIRSVFIFSIVAWVVLFLATLRVFGVELPRWTRAGAYGAIVGALAYLDWVLTVVQNKRSARLSRERDEASAAENR